MEKKLTNLYELFIQLMLLNVARQRQSLLMAKLD